MSPAAETSGKGRGLVSNPNEEAHGWPGGLTWQGRQHGCLLWPEGTLIPVLSFLNTVSSKQPGSLAIPPHSTPIQISP